MKAEDLIQHNLIAKMYAGSHAYGTALPTSDTDFRGIFCAPPENIRTPFFPIREVTDTSEEDTKFYELNQFMKLCLDCNPNIIELLWTDMSDVVEQHDEAYAVLRQNKENFLSKRIIYTTTGYAMAQLKRIRGHNKWLTQQQAGINALQDAYVNGRVSKEWLKDNFDEEFLEFLNGENHPRLDDYRPSFPDAVLKDQNVQLICKHRPRQTEYVSLVFNFTHEKTFKLYIEQYHDGYRLVPFSGDIYGLYRMEGYQTFSLPSYSLNTNYEGISADLLGAPLMLVKFNKDEYKQALEKYNQYWTWRNNRNAIRHELEASYGYDTKHAMHLVRLLRMGYEAVTEGVIKVKRPDAQELLDIRFGKWKYEEVVQYAEELERKVFDYGKNHSTLRHSPDLKNAANVVMQVQDIMWSRK